MSAKKTKFINKWKKIIVDYFIKSSFEKIIQDHNKDLRIQAQQQASITSYYFIKTYLLNTSSFETKFELLRFALSKIQKSNENELFCEFGVFSGKTINFIADNYPNIIVYGFDSFEGIPEKWNFLEKGYFKVNVLPKVRPNVQLIKGWFNEALPEFLKINKGNVSFLHIDSDLYSSAKTIFTLMNERIVSGTVIVFDEFFNYPFWEEGEYRAFMEFTKSRNIIFEYIGYCYKGEQVALRIL